MTDGQIRYQTVLENQRHNLAMERLGQQEADVARRNVAVKESEEQRAVALFPQQKVLMQSQAQSNIGNTWRNASEVAMNIIKGARGLLGLFGDAASLAGNFSGMAGGGYYQGSLFA